MQLFQNDDEHHMKPSPIEFIIYPPPHFFGLRNTSWYNLSGIPHTFLPYDNPLDFLSSPPYICLMIPRIFCLHTPLIFLPHYRPPPHFNCLHNPFRYTRLYFCPFRYTPVFLAHDPPPSPGFCLDSPHRYTPITFFAL